MKDSIKSAQLTALMTALPVLGGLTAQPALAQKQVPQAKLEASVGSQYDSNITTEELDISTTTNDIALLLDLDFAYKQPLTKDLSASAAYGFSQSLYKDLDEFDLQSHLLSAGLAYDFDSKTAAGLNYNYADSALDGDGFLSLHRVSPFASRYFSKQLFVRTAYAYTDKRFDGRRNRDASASALDFDVYYFLDGPRNYLIAGYRYKTEEAESARFDYDGFQLKLRWVKRLSEFCEQCKFRLGWRMEQRDYDDISSANGSKRDDTRQRWSADFEIPLRKNTELLLEYEYSDFESNLAAVDYIQHLARVRVNHRFF